tara:strand:+ start:12161 stop:12706 length:546 start_codon:yes stop_codon:yes gene_type:complete
MSQRLFAALALPDAILDRLMGVQSGLTGASWRPRANLHLTLRFFGELDAAQTARLKAALLALPLHTLSLVIHGAGWFGGDRPTALWARAEPTEGLLALRADIEAAARDAGLAADERGFIPHITLAYLQQTPEALVAAKVADLQDLRCEPHTVESFNLYSSDTALGDANLYRVAARYPSAGS